MTKDDQMRVNVGYALLHEAYNALVQIQHMDSPIARIVRVLGATEDKLYDYVTTDRKVV